MCDIMIQVLWSQTESLSTDCIPGDELNGSDSSNDILCERFQVRQLMACLALLDHSLRCRGGFLCRVQINLARLQKLLRVRSADMPSEIEVLLNSFNCGLVVMDSPLPLLAQLHTVSASQSLQLQT